MKIILVIIAIVVSHHMAAQPAIGMWREHLPYNNAIDIAIKNDTIFCATPFSLFAVSTSDNSIHRYSRITGLSETGISAISYDDNNKNLFIAYTNSHIDIVHGSDIIAIPDINRDNIIGNKTIYAIYPSGKNYYLSTGLGVIVIDGEKYEVKDSWFIGNNGNKIRVNAFASDGSFYYAATEEGLKRVPINTANPADYSRWEVLSGNNNLPAGNCNNVSAVQNKIIAQHNDSLFVLNSNTWALFYENGWPIVNVSVSGNKILLSQRKPSGEARVTILNVDGTVNRSITQPTVLSHPRKAVLFQDQPWVADESGGLVHFTASSYEQYQPNSPQAGASGQIVVSENTVYVAAGEVNRSGIGQNNFNGIYILKESTWTNINRSRFPELDTMPDIVTITVDPVDQTAWAGSFGGGLLHLKTNGSFNILKRGIIAPALVNPSSYRVAGLAFDMESNLWVANDGAGQPLLAKKKDGSWARFSPSIAIPGNTMSQIIVDDNNYKWIVSPGNGLVCFDHGSSLENTGDDRWKLLRQGSGNGNLPAGDVLSIAKDKNGFIWVGTTNGVGVVQCPEFVFSGQGCDAIWPVVQQGNFAGYLFNGEEVRSIAVDGADRKWIATGKGVWLISATGENVIYRFTQENSPLLSNDVKKLAIDGQNGEVFIATAKGLCSFRSTATEGGSENKNVLVFPNPVPPGFGGTIAVRGLVNNAIVKITELDGRLVYQTMALGGQATWDGKDFRGRRISSGVYLVLVTDPASVSRNTRTAAKIVFVSK